MSGCYITLAVSEVYGPFHNPVTGARYSATELAVLFHVIGRPRFADHYPADALHWRGVFGTLAQHEGSS